MATRVERQTVDLSQYPDLVVIYLGMRVNMLTGLRTLFRIGPQINGMVASKPDGLLCHENFMFSLFPPHLGMRQYWRDLESLEGFTRSEPHRTWWANFLRDSGGTGFWHEAYFLKGGMEAIYDDVPVYVGLGSFAARVPARGAMFGARRRAHRADGDAAAPVLAEQDLYSTAE